MNSYCNSILATIVYYDIFDFPLTMVEIHKYLINPGRLFRDPVLETISLSQVAESLEGLVADGLVDSKNGFYFLSDRESLCELRTERKKIAAQKWKKFLRTAKWFQTVPYLRAVLASGSLAINNTTPESDFDVLTVAKSGRLYICRIFLCLITSFFRARRTRYEKTAPDKFCFNHYITDGDMNIKHESLYNAQTYANLKPVLVDNNFVEKFYTANNWLGKYILNFDFKVQPQKICEVEPFKFIAKFLEFILNSKMGDWIEILFKKYQHKRIKENPATYESGGRVIFNDNELEFHPRSFEAFAIDRYNKGLKRLGIISHIEEKDSGLTA